MSRMYETIYIVKPDLTDEENKALTTKVNEVVAKMNGDVRKLEDWGIRKLAYPINKVARLDDKVVRYQTVKLEKEATVAAPAKPVEAEETAPAEEAVPENE